MGLEAPPAAAALVSGTAASSAVPSNPDSRRESASASEGVNDEKRFGLGGVSGFWSRPRRAEDACGVRYGVEVLVGGEPAPSGKG